jgi:hypothetical protein
VTAQEKFLAVILFPFPKIENSTKQTEAKKRKSTKRALGG